MYTSEFWFDLPERLIARRPIEPRDHCRLMVIDRATGRIEHTRFDELFRWISQEDLLILNNTRVLPARLSADDGAVEILLLQETSPLHWLAIGRPGSKLKAQRRLHLDPVHPVQSGATGKKRVEVEILKTLPSGERVICFFEPIDLHAYGRLPLPPYIEEARVKSGEAVIQPCDADWYQTAYAEVDGSVAAPTAGLHFTPELLTQFNHAFITLHVGLGTFRPIKTENIEEHVMQEESYSIPAGLRQKAAAARRVVAVGSTVARVLETEPTLQPGSGTTRLFIRPPYPFKHVDAMITNFHLPGSTLLVMIATFMGIELQRKAYREAIEKEYRFYSYGDAMLIL